MTINSFVLSCSRALVLSCSLVLGFFAGPANALVIDFEDAYAKLGSTNLSDESNSLENIVKLRNFYKAKGLTLFGEGKLKSSRGTKGPAVLSTSYDQNIDLRFNSVIKNLSLDIGFIREFIFFGRTLSNNPVRIETWRNGTLLSDKVVNFTNTSAKEIWRTLSWTNVTRVRLNNDCRNIQQQLCPGDFKIDNLRINEVPEPAGLALIGLALAALGFSRRQPAARWGRAG